MKFWTEAMTHVSRIVTFAVMEKGMEANIKIIKFRRKGLGLIWNIFGLSLTYTAKLDFLKG